MIMAENSGQYRFSTQRTNYRQSNLGPPTAITAVIINEGRVICKLESPVYSTSLLTSQSSVHGLGRYYWLLRDFF